jgi:hypothetical protein
MLRDWIWIHFHVRIFRLMPLKVYLKVAFCGKSVATNIALERPFARMRPNVDLESRIRAEYLSTVTTSMPIRWILFSVLSKLQEVRAAQT